jgi:hypothetical protein
VGVELSAALYQIALHNIGRYKDPLQECKRLRVVCQDAVDYRLPLENIVLFIYNPFHEAITRLVVSNVERALLTARREFYVVYVNPLYRRIWEQSIFFEAIYTSDSYMIYKNRLS